MRRFFVPPPSLDSDRIALDTALARRLSQVLRLRAGDEMVLFDGDGHEARVRIEALSARGGEAAVFERFASPAEPRVAVHLYQAIAKGERFEWLVEKATELGVARIVPLIAARSVVRTGGGGTRSERWRRIAIEAAEQCGRGVVPVIDEPLRFADALASSPGARLLPYEMAGEGSESIRDALARQEAVSDLGLFIGPEGGFETEEVRAAHAAGVTVVTMGRRILRCETAGLVALALVMEAVGELG